MSKTNLTKHKRKPRKIKRKQKTKTGIKTMKPKSFMVLGKKIRYE